MPAFADITVISGYNIYGGFTCFRQDDSPIPDTLSQSNQARISGKYSHSETSVGFECLFNAYGNNVFLGPHASHSGPEEVSGLGDSNFLLVKHRIFSPRSDTDLDISSFSRGNRFAKSFAFPHIIRRMIRRAGHVGLVCDAAARLFLAHISDSDVPGKDTAVNDRPLAA